MIVHLEYIFSYLLLSMIKNKYKQALNLTPSNVVYQTRWGEIPIEEEVTGSPISDAKNAMKIRL